MAAKSVRAGRLWSTEKMERIFRSWIANTTRRMTSNTHTHRPLFIIGVGWLLVHIWNWLHNFTLIIYQAAPVPLKGLSSFLQINLHHLHRVVRKSGTAWGELTDASLRCRGGHSPVQMNLLLQQVETGNSHLTGWSFKPLIDQLRNHPKQIAQLRAAATKKKCQAKCVKTFCRGDVSWRWRWKSPDLCVVQAVKPKRCCFQAAAISVHSKDAKETSKHHTDLQRLKALGGQRPCGQINVSFRVHLKAKLMMLKMNSWFNFLSLYTPAAGVLKYHHSCFYPSPNQVVFLNLCL